MRILKFTFILFGYLCLYGCEKPEIENIQTINKLFEIYQDGEIEKCIYNGEVVYCGGLNAYDAGSSIYDTDGKFIASCNYAWNNVDSICYELKNCETIYRVKNNIWGLPEVNKYKLKKKEHRL